MQTADEQDELVLQVIATAEVIGQVISSTAAAMIAEDLERYSFVDCCKALKKCRAEVRGRLTLADVISRIDAADGRPAKDEAWGIALQSADERDTVIWTAEIEKAYDAARPILNAGDKVGARMAFNSAYERLLITARASGEPAQWKASIGWDGELRARAFEAAVKLERLPPAKAVAMLQQHGQGSPACAQLVDALLPPGADESLRLSGATTGNGLAIAQLLTGPGNRGLLALTHDEKTRNALLSEETVATRSASPDVKERLQQLRRDVAAHREQGERERRQLLEAQQRDLAQRKDKTQQKVNQALRGEGQ